MFGVQGLERVFGCLEVCIRSSGFGSLRIKSSARPAMGRRITVFQGLTHFTVCKAVSALLSGGVSGLALRKRKLGLN